MCADATQETIRRSGRPVPHENLRREQAQDREAQPALPARPGALLAGAEQVRGHAAPRVRAHHERVQQDTQVSSTAYI